MDGTILDLTGLFVQDGSLPFDFTLDLSELDFSGRQLFKTPVSVTGAGKSSAGVVTVTAKAEYVLSAECDRCAAPLEVEKTLNVCYNVANSLEDEDNDDFVLAADMKIDIGELVRQDLILSVPMKLLCRKDCKGLCPICGKNLNEGDCNCRKSGSDPRLDALKDFFN